MSKRPGRHLENSAGANFMREIHWDGLVPSLTQALFTITIFVIWTLVGAFVMKYFVRQVPILNHAAILFWAAFRVQIVVLALIVLGSIFGISVAALSGLFSVLALCTVGWLVTQHLSRSYRVPTKLPAVGAKVMTTMVIITLSIVVAIIVITKA
jgi:hypothetical protein